MPETESLRRQLIVEFQDWTKLVFGMTTDIVKRRDFATGRQHFLAMLADTGVTTFDVVRDLRVSDLSSNIQATIDQLFDNFVHAGGKASDIAGVGIDLSDHERYGDAERGYVQGVDVNLYSRTTFDFAAASDDDLSVNTHVWQGSFEEVEHTDLDGFNNVIAAEYALPKNDYRRSGMVVANDGKPDEFAERDAVAYAQVVVRALVAIEFHRCMAELVPRLVFPHDLVVVIGEHDMMFVPHTHYRVSSSIHREPIPTPNPENASIELETLKRIADMGAQLEEIRGLASKMYGGPKRTTFGKRQQ